MAVMHMITQAERSIARAVIKKAIDAGYAVSVNDGEETTVKKSRDAAAVLKAMFSTDEDYLLIYKGVDDKFEKHFAWVRFIYGNSGWDVINDFSTNLEDDGFMESIETLIDKWEAKIS